MNASKDNLVKHISAAICRFSTDLTVWTKEQFEKLVDPSLVDSTMGNTVVPLLMEAIKELESKKMIVFVGDKDHYIVLHPDYINKNLSDYVKTASLKKANEILSKYNLQAP